MSGFPTDANGSLTRLTLAPYIAFVRYLPTDCRLGLLTKTDPSSDTCTNGSLARLALPPANIAFVALYPT